MNNDRLRSKYLAPQSEVISIIPERLLMVSGSNTIDGNATFEDYEAFDLFDTTFIF